MKNLTLTLLFLGLFSGLSAQYVTIPDANFRSFLIQRYPSCFNVNQEMDTTCSAVVNEQYLYINISFCSSLDGLQYFDGLQELSLSQTPITSFPRLPNGLRTLDVGLARQLTTLPPLPSGLVNLRLTFTPITSLPSLPNSLRELSLWGCPVSSLPVLPNNLEYLQCLFSSALTSLPALPNGLRELNCSDNRLTSLPRLPDSLRVLRCPYNQISVIPTLPRNLIGLNCSSNLLTILPMLPPTLDSLYCDENQLTTLPELPNSLSRLGCGFNRLTSLPVLPSGLLELYCWNNQLTSLPTLPSGMTFLLCGNNPSLSCLPLLPNHLYLSLGNTAITCLPNYTPGITQASTGLPLCTNPNQICQTNPLARGDVFNDTNNNGIRDPMEVLVGGIPITVSPNNWTNISDTINGYFVMLDTLPVINVITPGVLPYRTFSPSSYSVTASSLGLLPPNYDFAMQIAQPNVTDLVTRISTWFHRPGFQASASVNVENIGTLDQGNASISLEIPSGLTVISTVPSSGVVTGNTVTWSGENIGILERKNYWVSLQVPPTMPLGTSLTYSAQASPATTDFTPADNIATETVVVRGSYDPNDKLVNKDRLPNNYVAADEEMLYTIRFQNTGTDTAFTVLVRDTLDLAKLDFSTFRVTGASHALRTNVRDQGVVEFVFNNINLPDSFVNEPLSHGYVQFRIHPKANLPLGTQIKNRAFIYFDFNTPIITNYATTTVGLLSVSSAELGAGSLSLYPVPVAEQLTVNFNAVRSGEVRYRLLDLQGCLLQEQQLSVTEGENISTMDMSKLGAGMYLLQVVGEQGSVSQKIIKE